MHFLHSDLIATYGGNMDGGQTTGTVIGSIVGYIIVVILYWRIFSKAGRAGWLAIIPIVNTIVLIQITKHSGWTVLFYIIPILNVIWAIVIAIHLGRSFGKGGVFSFFLLFWPLAIVGYIILAFGGSTYRDRTLVAA
jgi:hypothetical protein